MASSMILAEVLQPVEIYDTDLAFNKSLLDLELMECPRGSVLYIYCYLVRQQSAAGEPALVG